MSDEVVVVSRTKELERLEGIIQKNFESFCEVGRALLQIKADELFKEKNGGKYETFPAYCKAEWGITKQHANRLIASSAIIGQVEPSGSTEGITEFQVRPLSKLLPEQRTEAWEKAKSTAPNGKVTANHVEKVVKEMITEKKEVVSEKQTEKITKPKEPEAKKPSVEKKGPAPVDPLFQTAFDRMFGSFDHLNAVKWQTMSEETALNMVQQIVAYLEDRIERKRRRS